MSEPYMTFGAQRLSKKMIDDAAESGEEVNISVAGFLYVDADVTVDMIRDHVGYVFVNGMILGSQEVKDLLREKEAICTVPASNGKKKAKTAGVSRS